MKLLKYFPAVIVTAVICFFGLRWHYTGKIFLVKTGDVTKNNYYRMRHSMFTNAQTNEGCIIFLGDSLTEWLNLNELLPGVNVINRGIAGDTTIGVLHRLDEVIRHKPAKIFLLIGTNDIAMGMSERKLAGNIREIVSKIHEGSNESKIYLQTLIPVNSQYMGYRHNMKIETVNDMIRKIAAEIDCTLVDLYEIFAEDGELPLRYTFDGLHINGEGAQKWIDFIRPLL